MRIAILSDIHANLVALEAVLAEVEALQPDAIWCLGDVIGYGPEPQACIDLVRERVDVCLAGNHDLGVLDRLSLQDFSSDARTAALWQRGRVQAEALAWLGELSSQQMLEGITLVHASPRAPVWEYVVDSGVAAANASAFDTHICLLGHSHLALGWRLIEDGANTRAEPQLGRPEQPLQWNGAHRWLLNPGSVGQPRDRDPRAAFALLDTEAGTWNWRRCAYDIAAVEQAILAAGLPPILGRRLHLGW